jgi:hypothetical protein
MQRYLKHSVDAFVYLRSLDQLKRFERPLRRMSTDSARSISVGHHEAFLKNSIGRLKLQWHFHTKRLSDLFPP